jgi:hypothetical protein
MKLLKLVIVVLLVMALLSTYAVIAQDTTPNECNVESLTALADALQKAHDDALIAIKVGDLTTAMSSFSSTNAQVAELKAVCDGLSFTGKAAKVIGPVEIPAGTYRAIATTTGAIAVVVNATEGKCAAGGKDFLVFETSQLFNLSKGEETESAEGLFSSTGCTALLEVFGVQADWTLAFEKVG